MKTTAELIEQLGHNAGTLSAEVYLREGIDLQNNQLTSEARVRQYGSERASGTSFFAGGFQRFGFVWGSQLNAILWVDWPDSQGAPSNSLEAIEYKHDMIKAMAAMNMIQQCRLSDNQLGSIQLNQRQAVILEQNLQQQPHPIRLSR